MIKSTTLHTSTVLNNSSTEEAVKYLLRIPLLERCTRWRKDDILQDTRLNCRRLSLMVLTDTVTAQCTSAAMYHSLLTLSHSLSHQTGQKKTERTDRAWFSRLVRHPATKWSRSILTPRNPHGARHANDINVQCSLMNTWRWSLYTTAT